MSKKAPGFFKKQISKKDLEKKYLKFIDQKEDKAFICSAYEERENVLYIRAEFEKAEIKKLKKLAKAVKQNRKGLINIPLVAVLAILVSGAVVFFSFFLNPILERALESGLEAVFDARVDADNFRVSLFRMEIGMDGLAIADRDSPMQNLIQFGRMDIRLKPQAVFRGKVYIEEIRADAIRFGTERTVSGALPDKPPKVKPEKPKTDTPPLVDFANFDAAALLEHELDKLKTPALYGELTAAYETTVAKWNAQIQTAQNRVQTLQTQVQPFLNLNINDYTTLDAATVERVRARINEMNALVESVKTAEAEINGMVAAVQADVATAQQLEQNARNAFSADFDYLCSYLDISSGPAAGILDSVIRDVLSDTALTYLAYGERGLELLEKVKEIQAMLPKSSKPEQTEGEKFRGRDVVFPVTQYPQFYLGELAADVLTPGGWHWASSLLGVSSDPDLSNSVTTLNLSLVESGGARRSADFNGSADFRTDAVQRFNTEFTGAGFPVSLGAELSAAGIQGYTGDASFALKLAGLAAGDFSGSGSVSLFHSDLAEPSNTLAQAVDTALAKVASVDFGLEFANSADGASFGVQTNIGDLVMDALGDIAGQYIRQAEAELERVLREKAAEYIDESLVGKEELDALFALVRGDKTAIDTLRGSLDRKIAEFEGRLRSAAEDALEDVANQAVEEARRQGEQAVDDLLQGKTPTFEVPSFEMPSLPDNLFGF